MTSKSFYFIDGVRAARFNFPGALAVATTRNGAGRFGSPAQSGRSGSYRGKQATFFVARANDVI